VSALAIQDSSRLRDLTRADALILRAPGATAAGEGEVVEVLRLDELGL
jgi:molybdopterin biosynthesis enzyme